jgi:hypothetical protein
VAGFYCLNPSASRSSMTPNGCVVEFEDRLGDGNCDGGNYNSLACEWDFGDCCIETCGQGGWYQAFPCGSAGFDCLDPNVTQHPHTPPGCLVDNEAFLGDGWCDDGEYNSEACEWDFGDCCIETCGQGGWIQPFPCGLTEFYCLDPSVIPHPPPPIGCDVEFPEKLGDGNCTGGAYNTAACVWDFGDCSRGNLRKCELVPTLSVWLQ